MSARGEDRELQPLLRPAQTNLDLYRQLHALGYSEQQLIRIRDCYMLALSLFPNLFRATGKPFVAHLVGTASILAAAGASPETVAAGLLHAVYENGDFTDQIGAATEAHRQIVRDRASARVEGLVAAYHGLRWKPATVEKLAQNWDAVSAETRDILLMRIANELEDHVALGMRLCSETRATQIVPRDTHLELARRLGHIPLARALEEAYRETDDAHWAASLADSHDASYRVPANAGVTGTQHLAAALKAARRKLGRLVGLPARA